MDSAVPLPLPERLKKLVRRLSESVDLHSGLEAVAWSCDGVFAFYRVALVLPARQPDHLQVVAAWARRPEQELEGFDFQISGHTLEQVLTDGVPVVRTDPLNDHPGSPLTRLYREEQKCEELGVPLQLGGRRGLLVFASTERGGFQRQLFPWLEDLAYLVAVWVRPWLGHDTPFIVERQYQALLDGALDGIVVLSGDRVLYSNASFREIMGLPRDQEYRGSFLELLKGDSPAAFANALDWLDDQPRVLPRLDVEARRSDGQDLHLEIGIQSIFYLGESATLVQVHNASERMERERWTRSAAERSDALLADLAEGLSGPLGSLEDLSSQLLNLDSPLAGVQRQTIAEIHNESCKLLRLLEGVTEFSSLAVSAPEVTAFEIEKVFRQVEEELRETILAASAKIEYRRIPPVVVGRPEEVRRVLRSLVDNAIRYARDGVPPQVRVYGEGEEGAYYVFCVEDNGGGVNPLWAKDIFRLFGKKGGGRAGASLPIAQRIVEGYGGRMWLVPGREVGSLFYFTLPKPSPSEA